MEQSVILAGFGGQGLLFAGTVLARAALIEEREVLWIPAYGPEMRGGTAACTVIVSDEPVGSPIVDRLDVLIALNPPSLAKYEHLLAPGGLLVVNDSLIEAEPARNDVEVVRTRCTTIATRAGDERMTSVAGLGTALARRPIARPESARAALAALLEKRGAGVLAADLDAFEAGFEVGLEATGTAPAAR